MPLSHRVSYWQYPQEKAHRLAGPSNNPSRFLGSQNSRGLVASMSPFNNPVVLDLLARYKSIAAMTHASSLLGWDLEINMPEAGASARGQAQSEIELLRQKTIIDLAAPVANTGKPQALNNAE